MMNVPPGEAKALSMWEYEALLFHWNEAHSTDSDVQAPDADHVQRMIDKINLDPKLHSGKGKKVPANL